MAVARIGHVWGLEHLAPVDVTWVLSWCGYKPIDLGSGGDAACEGAEDGTLTRSKSVCFGRTRRGFDHHTVGG